MIYSSPGQPSPGSGWKPSTAAAAVGWALGRGWCCSTRGTRRRNSASLGRCWPWRPGRRAAPDRRDRADPRGRIGHRAAPRGAGSAHRRAGHPGGRTAGDAARAHPGAAASRGAGHPKAGFCTAADGVRLAYATSGTGPPLVKAANWLTHLDYDWASPVWAHWWRALSERHRFVRYDERGCGLSEWDVPDASYSLAAWVADLEAVVDDSRPRAVRPPGHLAGRSGGHRVCRTAPAARPQAGLLRRLRGGPGGPRRRPPPCGCTSSSATCPGRMGTGGPNLPAGVASQFMPGGSKDPGATRTSSSVGRRHPRTPRDSPG